MNNTATASLREFAEKWGISHGGSNLSSMCLSDLTALISEGYVPRKEYEDAEITIISLHEAIKAKEDAGYPKEFVEWGLEHIDSAPIKYRNRNGKIFLNIAEIYEYWKENVR